MSKKSNDSTKPSQQTPKPTMPGMLIAYYAYLAPEIFDTWKPLTVTYDEQLQDVSIDLTSLVPYPAWMQRLVIKLGPVTEEATVVVRKETGQWFVLLSQQELMKKLSDMSSTPNP